MEDLGELSVCYVSTDATGGGPALDGIEVASATPADVTLDAFDALIVDEELTGTDALGALVDRIDETPCVVVEDDTDPRDVELTLRTAVREGWTGYPIPVGEPDRLDRLSEYDFQEPMLSAHLDGLTTTARECIDAQVGFVGVVREHREEFLSVQGVDWETLERQDSVCTHGIVGDDPLVIEGLSEDPRVTYEAINDEYDLEFYAGVPLTTPNGDRIGMLCVMDEEPPEFDEDDEQALEWLAGQVTHYVEQYGQAS
ncbi:GAF domain-containing protein [Halarchaeum sp. P4]|uniref:GAF domain-containing protein n=1 Tax=Halarchaeum sp. P4 TaxID=3421639 RepID=UPI003EBDA305